MLYAIIKNVKYTIQLISERGERLNNRIKEYRKSKRVTQEELARAAEQKLGIKEPGPTRYGGEFPESEPETNALCRYLRADPKIEMILTFHTQGEEIFYLGGDVPCSDRIARRLSALSGYQLSRADGMAAYGGLTDWFMMEIRKPSFTVECGLGENPLPVTDFDGIYRKLREMLFTAPMLV